MTKALRKAIMIKYRIENRFHKTRSDENCYSTKHKETYARNS